MATQTVKRADGEFWLYCAARTCDKRGTAPDGKSGRRFMPAKRAAGVADDLCGKCAKAAKAQILGIPWGDSRAQRLGISVDKRKARLASAPQDDKGLWIRSEREALTGKAPARRAPAVKREAPAKAKAPAKAAGRKRPAAKTA